MNGHLQNLEQQFKTYKQDSARIVKEYEQTQKSLNSYRNDRIRKYPNSLLAVLLKAMMDPVVPENNPAAKTDSLFVYKYIKAHYWDGVSFYDDRLLNTPFFEQKLDFYFNQLVYPAADSVAKEIDWMLGYASINEEMQKFLLLHFVNRYRNQKHPWEDAVFLNLYEKHIADKNYSWLSDDLRKTITAKANTIMANTKGKPAADIELPDRAGIKKSLYSLQAPYTLVVIWDPICGHCKQILPVLDKLYEAKWKAMGLRVFAMAIENDGTKNDWISFIDKNKLTDWVNVYYSKEADKGRRESNLPRYPQLYDVTGLPTLYLLDKDKHIIAKKVPYTQVDALLEQISNTANH